MFPVHAVRTVLSPHAPLRQILVGTKQDFPPSPSRSAVARRLKAKRSCSLAAVVASRGLPQDLLPATNRGTTRASKGRTPIASKVTEIQHAEYRRTILQARQLCSRPCNTAAGCYRLRAGSCLPRRTWPNTPFHSRPIWRYWNSRAC